MSWALAYLEWSITPLAALREEQIRRGRLASAFSLATVPLAVVYMVIHGLAGNGELVVVMFAASALGVVTPLLLRITASPRITANFYVSVVFFAVASVSWLTGGIYGPGPIWLCVLPLAGGLLDGVRGAIAWGAAALSAVLALVLAPPEAVAWDTLFLLVSTSLFGQITIVTLLTVIFERHRSGVLGKLRASNEALTRAVHQAKVASEAKSRFLANVSHELRTPMNGVLGMAAILADTQLTGAQRAYLRTVQESGSALLALLDDILDLSKVEAEQLAVKRVAFDPAGIIHGVVRLLDPLAAGAGLQLGADLDPGGPVGVLGDPLRLRQVLTNLVGNAIKFTSEGSVTVRTRVTERGLRFSVVDTGPGIAEESQQRIFDPFTQVDESTTRAYSGTGLGLSISRGLVERMGDALDLESSLGAGSTFFFHLPLAADGAPLIEGEVEVGVAVKPVTTASPGGLPPVPSGSRVLLVDDDAVNRTVARLMLERMGCSVMEAGNGAEAVAAVEAASFDVVLMDCQMPVMDGYAACRSIRALPERGSVPIVGLTGNAMAAGIERCMAAGMDDHLAKPYSPQQLWETVARQLRGERDSGDPPRLPQP